MTVVVSTGPPTSAPQPGASSGASGAIGGVFAALFGTLNAGGETAPTSGDATASVPGVLEALLIGTAKAPAALDEAGPQGNSEHTGDDGAAPANAQALGIPVPLIALAIGLVATSEQSIAPPPASAVAAIGTKPAATPTSGRPIATDSDAPDTEPIGTAKPAQAAAQSANLPLPETETDPALGDQPPKTAVPRAILGTQPAANGLPPPASLPVDDSAVAALTEDTTVDSADRQPSAGPKKASTPSAAAGTPAGKASADSSSSSASPATPAISAPLSATATPDPLALPLTSHLDAPVKTVSVTSLAGLSQQAVVTAIGAAIATEANGGTNRFIIRLDPPDLGRIDVRLHFDRDGELRARLVADRPDTVNLLTRDAGALERALNASGVRTADAGIDVSLRDSSGGFARSDGTFGNDAPSPYSTPAGTTTGDTLASNAFIWVRPQTAAGRLDLMV